MPANSTLPLRSHPPPQHSNSLSATTSSQEATYPAAPASASAPATRRSRPQREAATKAKKRLEDAYTLLSFDQSPDTDSDTSTTRPNTPWATTVHSDDSSDSDAFIDDSESDCPRRSEGRGGRKRKRSLSPMTDAGKRRRVKARKISPMGERGSKEAATGFMVKSGNTMRDILLETGRRASRGSFSGSAEQIHDRNWGRSVRRAGLSDMGPEIGSGVGRFRDVVWGNSAKGFAFENRKGSARGAVDGNGYRVSRFSEHF